jgi:hypothetical protein
VGRWQFDGATATYVRPLDTENRFGIALSTERLQRGSVEVTVRFASPLNAAGRVLFGYHPESEAYFTAGIGGYNRAFVIDEFVPGRGWRVIKATGSNSNLEEGREYAVAVNLSGQSIELVVDGIPVAQSNLPHPLLGDQLGAEVTPANPNVFYELGYAHAIQKPTILLAEKPTDPAKTPAFRHQRVPGDFLRQHDQRKALCRSFLASAFAEHPRRPHAQLTRSAFHKEQCVRSAEMRAQRASRGVRGSWLLRPLVWFGLVA